eukprot:1157520-Pelagomonas_calceolata.AAC.1
MQHVTISPIGKLERGSQGEGWEVACCVLCALPACKACVMKLAGGHKSPDIAQKGGYCECSVCLLIGKPTKEAHRDACPQAGFVGFIEGLMTKEHPLHMQLALICSELQIAVVPEFARATSGACFHWCSAIQWALILFNASRHKSGWDFEMLLGLSISMLSRMCMSSYTASRRVNNEKLHILAEHSSIFTELISEHKVQQAFNFAGPNAQALKYFRGIPLDHPNVKRKF